MDLLVMMAANELKKTGATKKLTIPGQINNQYEVCSIPLKYLYYNNQNGRINTAIKQYQAEHGELIPEAGDSEYNKIFEKFIYESNPKALQDTLQSIKDKTQQEPGVVLPDGRVIDGNRRLTALRMYQSEDGIPKMLEAIILPLDASKKTDEKIIKELELDLQLGHEERVDYSPIDRIFDVYNTIKVKKLMNKDEYKKASGAKNIKGINRDIRLAKLIIKFIKIVSPGGNPIDKFYLARDLKIDGPIEEVESVLNNLKDSNKEAITDAVLVNLAISRVDADTQDSTRFIRDLKTNVLKNPEILEHYLPAVDEKVDNIVDYFEEHPIKSANDIKKSIVQDSELKKETEKLKKSTRNLVYKGKNDFGRKRALFKLEGIRNTLDELNASDFEDLTTEENLDAKDVIKEIRDILFKLKKDLNVL